MSKHVPAVKPGVVLEERSRTPTPGREARPPVSHEPALQPVVARLSEVSSFAMTEADAEIYVGQAAWMLEDALGRPEGLAEKYPKDLVGRQCYFKAAKYDKVYKQALVLMIILTVMETPTWCHTVKGFWSYMDPQERCVIEQVAPEDILLSTVPYIPPGYGLCVEWLFLLMMIPKLWYEWKLQSKHFNHINDEKGDRATYVALKWVKFGVLMILVELADSIIFLTKRPQIRFAFIARTGLMLLLPDVRKLLSIVKAVVVPMISIALFLIICIVFFAWIVLTLFGSDPTTVDIMHDTNVSKGFDSFKLATYSMFVSGTTDDFLGIFLPTYTAYRQSGLLWFFFLFFVQVLLLGLVLDTLVAEYQTKCEIEDESYIDGMANGLRKAYRTLCKAAAQDGKGKSLSKQTFMKFLSNYSDSPKTRKIPPETASIMFDCVDHADPDERVGSVDQRQFCQICSLMQYDIVTTKKDSPIKDSFPTLWQHPCYVWLRRQIEKEPEFGANTEGGNPNFDTVMTCVLMLNLALVVAETVYDMNDWPETWWMENLEFVFSFVYVGEITLRLSVYNWQEYWCNPSNKFDFFTTWGLLGSSIFELVVEDSGSMDIKRYMNILRLLRLLRVIKQLKRLDSVQFMVGTIVKLVTAAEPFLILLGVVTFFFTTLSVQLWGGLLYSSNPNLAETEWYESNYFVFNFHDFLMAFGVWVVALLCEYVPQFAEAVSSATKSPFSWWIFPIFYVCGCSIVFELVKAFTIETYLKLDEISKEEKREAAEKEEEEEEEEEEGAEATESEEGDAREEINDEKYLCRMQGAFDAVGQVLHAKERGDVLMMRKLKEKLGEAEEEEVEYEEHHH